MVPDAQRPRVQVDRDGVRVVESRRVRRQVWWVVLAIVVVGSTTILLTRWRRVDDAGHSEEKVPDEVMRWSGAPPEESRQGTPIEVADAAPRVVPLARRTAEPGAPASQPGSAPVDTAPGAEAADTALPNAEEPTGIALFPPMGTDPIKRGVIVPERFELPPGYVRHYQTTDDGESLPAILMFHPDFEFVDEHGNKIEVPQNRVVPPELVPAGMPVQMLEVPEETVPTVDLGADQPVHSGPSGPQPEP